MSSGKHFDGPSTLVPGTLRGYRFFSHRYDTALVDEGLGTGVLRLGPVSQANRHHYAIDTSTGQATAFAAEYVFWDKKMIAECMWHPPINRYVVLPSRTLDAYFYEYELSDRGPSALKGYHEYEYEYRFEEPHSAPDAGCRCGFYGFYTPELAFNEESYGLESKRGLIFGVVEFSGRIIMGNRGFRAERAELIAVEDRYADTYVSEEGALPTKALHENLVLPEDVEKLSREVLIEKYPPVDLDELFENLGIEREAPEPPSLVDTTGTMTIQVPYNAASAAALFGTTQDIINKMLKLTGKEEESDG